MTTHSLHEGDSILFDGCGRCYEIAEEPFSQASNKIFEKLVEIWLDDYNFARRRNTKGIRLTENEVVACNNIRKVRDLNAKIDRAIANVNTRVLLN